MNTTLSSSDKRVSKLRLAGRQRSLSLLELELWMPSETEAISPTIEQLMRLIEPWRCITGDELAVELALREALKNAVIHGNRLEPNKLVEIHCRCERGRGVWLTVRDEGTGFDPSAVPSPLGGLAAEHGRGLHLMKLMMDEVSFKRGGSEVHMRKGIRASRQDTCRSRLSGVERQFAAADREQTTSGLTRARLTGQR